MGQDVQAVELTEGHQMQLEFLRQLTPDVSDGVN
jgi:hypothetical protein